MNIKQFIDLMEYYAPTNLSFDYDNQKIGFILNLLKYKKNNINNIGFCVDITVNIIKKAKNDNIDILVCHHNPFYNMKYRIDDDNVNCLKMLFDSEISLYCAHTNYDNSINGMNFAFSKFLNIKNLCFLRGVYIGEFENNFTTIEIIDYISKKLNIKHFSYIGDEKKIIKKVLVCCGSGFTNENLDIAKK